MDFLYFFWLKTKKFEERVLGIEILSKVVFLKKTREKQKLDFFLNEKYNLLF